MTYAEQKASNSMQEPDIKPITPIVNRTTQNEKRAMFELNIALLAIDSSTPKRHTASGIKQRSTSSFDDISFITRRRSSSLRQQQLRNQQEETCHPQKLSRSRFFVKR